MISVVVVDDQELVRSGFRMLLSVEDDMEVVGEAADGEAALEVVRSAAPDVVLMDVQMPGMDGLEATRRIVAGSTRGPRPYIVAMTASALVEDRDACTSAGMDDYLSKPVRARDLAQLLALVPRRRAGLTV